MLDLETFREYLLAHLDTVFATRTPDVCPIARALGPGYSVGHSYYWVPPTMPHGMSAPYPMPGWATEFVRTVDEWPSVTGAECLDLLKGISSEGARSD